MTRYIVALNTFKRGYAWKPASFGAQDLLQAYLDLHDVLPKDKEPMNFHGSKAMEVRFGRLNARSTRFGPP